VQVPAYFMVVHAVLGSNISDDFDVSKLASSLTCMQLIEASIAHLWLSTTHARMAANCAAVVYR